MTHILIFAPNGHGTSLLAHTFRLCGMNYGRETYGWKDSFYHHLERSDIEKAMEERNWVYIQDVLDSYNHYPSGVVSGLKLTHFRPDNWEFILPILDQYWPECKRFMTIRHPYEMQMRNKLSNIDGTERKVFNIQDQLEIMSFQLELIRKNNFRAVVYPDFWDNMKIIGIVKEAGLSFNHAIFTGNKEEIDSTHAINTKHFVWDKPTRASQEDKDQFEKEQPHLHDKYMELLGQVT